MSRMMDWEPLAGSDPVPGDVYQTSQLARDLQNMAQTINDQSAALRRLASSQAWHAETEQQFAQAATKVADDLDRVHGRYIAAAEGVSYYATQLEIEQGTTATLLSQAQQLQADRDAAQSRIDIQDQQPSVDSTGATIPKSASYHADQHTTGAYGGRLRHLQNQADDSTSRIQQAAAKAAGHISEVAGSDGLKDGFWDKVGDVIDHVVSSVDGAVDSVLKVIKDGINAIAPLLNEISKVAQLVGAVAGLLALVTCWIPGVGEFFGAVAMAAGAVALLADGLLAVVGKKSIGDLLLDGLAVASGGIARVAGGVIKGVAAASKLEEAGAGLVRGGRLTEEAATAVKANNLGKAAELSQLSEGKVSQLYGASLGRLTQGGFMKGGRAALQEAVKEGGPIADKVTEAGGRMKFAWQETKGVVKDLNPTNLKGLSPGAIRDAASHGVLSMRTAGWQAVLEHGVTGGQAARLATSSVISVHDVALGASKIIDVAGQPGALADPGNYEPTGADLYNPKDLGDRLLGRSDLYDLTKLGAGGVE